MGWFDFLKRSDPKPDDVRQDLFDAFDPERFEKLCLRYETVLVEHAVSWAKVPEAIREDAGATQRYAEMLIALAQWLASRGHAELLETIMGGAANNPLRRADAQLGAAQELMEALRFAEAAEVLSELKQSFEGLEGPGRDHYEAFIEGFLGQCWFQLGRAAEGVAPTRRAHELCVAAGDVGAAAGYLSNLFEMHRYQGDATSAARVAEQIAELVNDAEDAPRWRKRAAVVKAGEPLCRVVAVIDDEVFELDELPAVGERRVQFVFERNRITLQPCAARVQEGKALGSEANFEAAVEAFRQASEHDGYDPDPWYQLGFTHMCLGRYGEAVTAYDRAEELAPGWFHCREDRFVAQLLLDESIDDETRATLAELEDGDAPPRAKLAMAEAALDAHPELSLLHLHRGIALMNLDRKDDALAAFRRGLEATWRVPAIETRLLARLASVADGEERDDAIDRAIALDGDRVSAAIARTLRRVTAH